MTLETQVRHSRGFRHRELAIASGDFVDPVGDTPAIAAADRYCHAGEQHDQHAGHAEERHNPGNARYIALEEVHHMISSSACPSPKYSALGVK